MSPPADPTPPAGNPPAHRMLPGRRQLIQVALVALVVSVLLRPLVKNPFIEIAGEVLFVAMMLLFSFTAAGAWRQDIIPRWAAQVLAIAAAAMMSPLIVQLFTFGGDLSAFLGSRAHVRGYFLVATVAVVVGTFSAVRALQSERARGMALRDALERETLQRQAADKRLGLLTAQIQPHFLLNTLANVQELVESGSPRAGPVFRSLIEYLRAAMPRLQDGEATLGDEERLVRAYLHLMQMRMPDRLAFSVAIDPALGGMRFPPMALLTLVENAIQHGIDPSCDPGQVEVGGRRIDKDTVQLWVADTGVGLSDHAGQGTGLVNLDARLRAFFGEGTRIELTEQAPHGVRADIRVRVPVPA
ncbi:MAG: histidine kinase [Burkholderiales bacterium]|nr:histidine kinase [Burkholderiales bacterium]